MSNRSPQLLRSSSYNIINHLLINYRSLQATTSHSTTTPRHVQRTSAPTIRPQFGRGGSNQIISNGHHHLNSPRFNWHHIWRNSNPHQHPRHMHHEPQRWNASVHSRLHDRHREHKPVSTTTPPNNKYLLQIQDLPQCNSVTILQRSVPLFEVLPCIKKTSSYNLYYQNSFLLDGIKYDFDPEKPNKECGKLRLNYSKYLNSVAKKTKPSDREVIFGNAKILLSTTNGWERSRIEWLQELERKQEKERQQRELKKKLKNKTRTAKTTTKTKTVSSIPTATATMSSEQLLLKQQQQQQKQKQKKQQQQQQQQQQKQKSPNEHEKKRNKFVDEDESFMNLCCFPFGKYLTWRLDKEPWTKKKYYEDNTGGINIRKANKKQ